MSLASRSDVPAAVATTQDLTYVEAVVRNASSSFFWAMRSLPLDRRRAIFAVYAFCREVDDIADGEEPLADRHQALQAWREEIDRLYTGAPTGPITRALLQPKDIFALERQDFIAVIDGMEMDAEAAIIAPAWEDLLVYCDRVACAVGRLCVKIFGEPGDNGQAVAKALGTALQLTNILRDVQEDAERGRVYLPAEILIRHGITEREPQNILTHPNLLAAWSDLANRTAEAFTAADDAMALCSRDAMRPARIMMEVYRKKFDRMVAKAVHDLPKPPNPGSLEHYFHKAEKLLIAARYGFT